VVPLAASHLSLSNFCLFLSLLFKFYSTNVLRLLLPLPSPSGVPLSALRGPFFLFPTIVRSTRVPLKMQHEFLTMLITC
jgi:hypothetical protein